MTVAYITHTDCLLHAASQEHPEQSARLTAIADRLSSSGLASRLQYYEAEKVERRLLERVHEPGHVFRIFTGAPGEGVSYLDPDTFMNPKSLDAAMRAAGAVVQGVDLVMAGEANAAFCAVRPPGHHAEHNRAMGFCFFNNIAVGVVHALEVHGLERIAIVDFDVHHGNGTEDIFRDDPRVLLCSSFQHYFYPFSGFDTRNDHILNLPLPAGTDGETFRKQVMEHWFSALEEFRPQMLFFSAGFDAHAEDPLGGMQLHEDDFAWITREVRTIAERHAGGRIVSTLEGGYDLSALARSVAAHIEVLL